MQFKVAVQGTVATGVNKWGACTKWVSIFLCMHSPHMCRCSINDSVSMDCTLTVRLNLAMNQWIRRKIGYWLLQSWVLFDIKVVRRKKEPVDYIFLSKVDINYVAAGQDTMGTRLHQVKDIYVIVVNLCLGAVKETGNLNSEVFNQLIYRSM